MQQVKLNELKMNTRAEAIGFLKKLWREEPTACPICGQTLEILHKKAKKDSSDWQCKTCDKTFKAFNLPDEINAQMPN